MTKEEEILSFLETRLFTPVLSSSTTTERFKKATRGLRLRLKERKAEDMISYFWTTVVDTQAKHANYARMLQNENVPGFEDVVHDFRLQFKER